MIVSRQARLILGEDAGIPSADDLMIMIGRAILAFELGEQVGEGGTDNRTFILNLCEACLVRFPASEASEVTGMAGEGVMQAAFVNSYLLHRSEDTPQRARQMFCWPRCLPRKDIIYPRALMIEIGSSLGHLAGREQVVLSQLTRCRFGGYRKQGETT